MATNLIKRAMGESLIHEVWRVDYTELDAASTTESISLVTLPAGAIGLAAWIDNVTAATDSGSISALAIEVGDAGDADALVASYDLFGATGRVQNVAAGSTEVWGSMAVVAKFTATGANLGDGAGTTDLDSGEVDVHLIYMDVR
ncbi:MAG: hypothetical protein ACO3N4_06635 [Ilumatobacteraceae bacterium]